MPVEQHSHNGVDSPKIKLGDLMLFSSTVPTKPAKEGTMVLYVNSTTYRLYIRINQLWKYVALT
jgi:hypothetical protein